MTKPNRARITALIKLMPTLKYDGKGSEDAPRKNKDRFNMDTYIHACGTPACIAGHTVAQFSGITPEAALELQRASVFEFPQVAATLLGLDEYWAEHTLFEPTLNGIDGYKDVTPLDAKRALTNLLKAIKAGKDYTRLDEEDLWGKKLVGTDY